MASETRGPHSSSKRKICYRNLDAPTYLVSGLLPIVALCKKDGFKEQRCHEKSEVEFVLQFDYEAITEKNTHCENEERISSISEATDIAKVLCELAEVQPECPVSGNLAAACDVSRREMLKFKELHQQISAAKI
jgi:hypothetical protein